MTKFKKAVFLEDIAMIDGGGRVVGYLKEIRHRLDNNVLGYIKVSRMGMAGCRPYLGRIDSKFIYNTIENATAALKHYVM